MLFRRGDYAGNPVRGVIVINAAKNRLGQVQSLDLAAFVLQDLISRQELPISRVGIPPVF